MPILTTCTQAVGPICMTKCIDPAPPANLTFYTPPPSPIPADSSQHPSLSQFTLETAPTSPIHSYPTEALNTRAVETTYWMRDPRSTHPAALTPPSKISTPTSAPEDPRLTAIRAWVEGSHTPASDSSLDPLIDLFSQVPSSEHSPSPAESTSFPVIEASPSISNHSHTTRKPETLQKFVSKLTGKSPEVGEKLALKFARLYQLQRAKRVKESALKRYPNYWQSQWESPRQYSSLDTQIPVANSSSPRATERQTIQPESPPQPPPPNPDRTPSARKETQSPQTNPSIPARAPNSQNSQRRCHRSNSSFFEPVDYEEFSLPEKREETRRLSEKREEKSRLSERRKETSRLSAKRKETPRLSERRKETSRLSARRKETSRLSEKQEGSSRPTSPTPRIPPLMAFPVPCPAPCFEVPALRKFLPQSYPEWRTLPNNRPWYRIGNHYPGVPRPKTIPPWFRNGAQRAPEPPIYQRLPRHPYPAGPPTHTVPEWPGDDWRVPRWLEIDNCYPTSPYGPNGSP